MSKENNKTLEVYNQTANIYLAQTIAHEKQDPTKTKQKREHLENLIKSSFSSLKRNSKVLEIGSGDGINAQFIEKLGFDVTASDVAPDFLKAIQKLGLKAITFNAIEDDFPQRFDAVFCWRVFVHFTKEDASILIKKVYNNLENNGIFVFNAMNRENKTLNNEWIDFEGDFHMGVERYYNYFYQQELDDMITQSGFKIINFYTDGGKNNTKWLVYVLKK